MDDIQGEPSRPDPEQVKVMDRQGRVKYVPRSEYERKKRRRRSSKEAPVREILSLSFIVIVIVVASYIALKLIK